MLSNPNSPGTFACQRGATGDFPSTGSFKTKSPSETPKGYGWQNDGKSHFGALIEFDPSTVSSLYQNGLNEVRVNALFGLNLIKAF